MKYKKIIIFGLTGSGKTTLANKLSKILKIKSYCTDDLVYKRRWDIKVSEKEFKEKLNRIVKKDKWIIEGVYSKWMNQILKKADLVISLDIKKPILMKRVIKRSKKQNNSLKEILKLIYKIFRWNSKWYDRCKKYSKNFKQIKNDKEMEELIRKIK